MSFKREQRFAVAVLALTLALGLANCGGSGNGGVSLTIGRGSSPEQRILAQIYKQALERTGYATKEVDLGPEAERGPGALKQEKVSGYPDHLSNVLTSFGVALEDVPPNARKAYAQAKADLEEEGLTAFPPTPFSATYAIGLLRRTAERRHLKTVSDLKREARGMSLRGPLGCHFAVDCLGGLEENYGIVFGGGYLEDEISERFKVLEDGEADASILYSTDGRLAGERSRFVILEEDRHTFPAGNALFVTTPRVVEEAGPDYEGAILAAQGRLTLAVMQRLDAQVELQGRGPGEIAAEYLDSVER